MAITVTMKAAKKQKLASLEVAGLFLQNTSEDTWEFHDGEFSVIVHRDSTKTWTFHVWLGWCLLLTGSRTSRSKLVKLTASKLRQLRFGLENVK